MANILSVKWLVRQKRQQEIDRKSNEAADNSRNKSVLFTVEFIMRMELADKCLRIQCLTLKLYINSLSFIMRKSN